MSELVTVQVENHIARVTLNRPDKMNALSQDMFDAIIAAAKSVRENRDVRVVVLSGEGRCFCAGLDLSMFQSGALQDPFGPGKGGFWPNFYQQPGYLWKDVPVPVIAVLHGATFGGGLQIALGADIRIAAPDTQMSVMEIKWGLIPDMSGSQTLRDLVRLDVAKELTFTGRVVAAEEACQLGLVTRVADDPMAVAMAMAEAMVDRNPDALTLGKYLLEHSWHGDDLEGLRKEEKLQARLLGNANQMEAVMASMQKRKPAYGLRQVVDFSELDGI